MSRTRTGVRHYWVALRAMLVFTIALGIVYPLAMTGLGQAILPGQANASLVHGTDGAVVGSSLIGQSFTDASGQPLAGYFQSRPSAAGDGYDGASSGGSNLGPESPELIAQIQQRRAQVAEFNHVDPATVPADALTASSSGLDPHISPEYARLQAARVAAARDLPETSVRALVEHRITGRDLGVLGEQRVNVLELNVALEQLRE